MVAEDLLVSVVFSSRGIDEPTGEDIEYTGLKEYQLLLVSLADGTVQLPVSWQQIFVVRCSRQQEILRIAIEISPSWLIDELITQQIRLIGQIRSDYLPSFAQMIQKSSFICKKILLQFHHIVGKIILRERYLQAILNKRKPFLIIPYLNLQRRWKALPLCSPSRQSLSTKLLNKQILMRIKQHVYSKLIALPYNIPNGLDIGIVVLRFLRLDALPSAV